MLFYAFLAANSGWRADDLGNWAKKVLSEEARRKSLGPDWTPPADAWWRHNGKPTAPAFEPIFCALRERQWEKPELDRIGAALQRWRGDGRCDGLGYSELRRQLRKDRPVTSGVTDGRRDR